MNDYVINAKNIVKSYDDLVAVGGLSFTVKSSTCFGFLGPNGAGKTTLMKMLYAKVLRDKDRDSTLEVMGFDPEKNELEIKARTGIVPQEDNLDVELDVLQNLLIYARFYHIKRKEALKRIEELLVFMELSDKKKAPIRALSGGMKRRLLIARALINNPELLVLDEPTTGLDPQVRQLIWDKLRVLKKKGVTILLTTHYMDEAFQIADTILIMDKGRRLVEGNPKKLLAENMEPYVLEIVGKNAAAKIKSTDARTARKEDAGERILFYSKNITTLKKLSMKLPTGSFHLRESNLEDLFLRTTGRKLNAVQ